MRGTKILIRTLAFWIVVALAGTVPLGSAATDLFPEPVVVVYPFTVSGSSGTSAVGGNVALLLATRLGELGGVSVKPFTPGTVRADYLTAARGENADYYVTGFLAPIGSEVSLITQVVTTNSGLVVWSSTTTIRTYGDASAQADPLHQAILAHAGRALSAIPVQSAAATPQPATSDAASFNVTRALGRHRKGQAATAAPSPAAASQVSAASLANAPPAAAAASASPGPAATVAVTTPLPSPAARHRTTRAAVIVAATPSALPVAGPSVAPGAAVAAPPAATASTGQPRPHASEPAAGIAVATAATISPGPPGALITDVGGTGDAATRNYAGNALASALRRAGITRGGNVPISGADAVAHAADLCHVNAGSKMLYVPTLVVAGNGPRSVTVDVDAYDCTGKAAGSQHDVETASGRRGLEHAIDRAAQKAVDAFLRAAPSPRPASES